MKQTLVTMPEIGAIAATRGMLGAGAALLLADRLPKQKRNALGWMLFLIGAISTIPLARDILGKMNAQRDGTGRLQS